MADHSIADASRRVATVPPTPAAVRMEELARLTDDLKAVVPPGATVGYIDYPMHMNVGDLLIYMGTMDFFQANANRISGAFCIFDASRRAFENLSRCDVIVCHGGGNFGDLYPRHQSLREQVVRQFPDKPIVVMPQSFHFGSEAAMHRSAEVFSAHRNLTLCVRDLPSRDLARAFFSDRVLLVPDMAHRLYAHFGPVRAQVKEVVEPLFLIRRDVEATVHGASASPRSHDWSTLLGLLDKVRIGRHRVASILAGTLDVPMPDLLFAHHDTVTGVVGDLAERLVSHGHWTTSRLHGAIFGLLLDQAVELLDNSYGKNSRYFAQWGAGLPNLTLG